MTADDARDLIEPSCGRDTPQKVAEEMFGKMRHSTKEEADAYDAMLKSKSVEIHPVDRDALLEEVKELERCARYFDLDFDEDEPLRDRLKEAAEDFAGCASRIREALGGGGRMSVVMDEAFVLGKIGEYGALQQIAEEASELAQAALKFLRFIKGDNPMYINGVRADKNDDDVAQQLIDNISEELSDVVLACDVAGFKPYKSMMRWKLSRWLTRLKENGNG